jgi:hypothetical protein
MVREQRIQSDRNKDILTHRISTRSVMVTFDIAVPGIENAIANHYA